MTKDFVTNRYGEKFYVGDRVCFMGQEHATSMYKTITIINDRGSWIDERGSSAWVPDNLVLIERPGEVSEGWSL